MSRSAPSAAHARAPRSRLTRPCGYTVSRSISRGRTRTHGSTARRTMLSPSRASRTQMRPIRTSRPSSSSWHPCTSSTSSRARMRRRTTHGAPEVVCGASNGNVWYYKNDGSWQTQSGGATKVIVDQSRTDSISTVAVGDFNGDGANDIAVGGANARLTWYPNLDKLGKFQNAGITDDWFAEGETTVKGNITSGSFLNTFVADASYEQVREFTFTEPVQSGATTNTGFSSDVSGWTYADWQDPTTPNPPGSATGTWGSSGGNAGGYASISTNCVANQVVSGYFYQSFAAVGSPPFTAQLSLDWKVVTFGATGAGGNVVLYTFVDPTSGAPTLGQQVWSSTAQTGTTNWASVPPIDVSSKVTSPGTYYLKIAFRAQNAPCGSTSTGGFDNIALTWSSTGGLASELEQYWRITQLPGRPGSTFPLNIIARHTANAEGDHYADLVVGTAGGKIWKYTGSLGGLTTPASCFYSTASGGSCSSAGTPIVGVKFGNLSTTQTGLEIVIAFGTTVRILTGFGSSGTVISSALPVYSPANAITALGVGDVNGDGPDDVVVGTSSDIWYWSNQNNGVSWTSAINVDSVGANVYSIDLGDASKAQHVGR